MISSGLEGSAARIRILHMVEFAESGDISRENIWVEKPATSN
jgi:hypothetical protein